MGVKRLWLMGGLCLLSSLVHAQFDAEFSQYWAVPTYYNPSAAGQTDALNITGAYSAQMVGFENAPKSMFFCGDMPFKFLGARNGVGLTFFNETIGLFTNQMFALQYSLKKKLWGGMLGAGITIGGLSLKFDPSNIDLGTETTDPAIPTSSQSGTSMDAGVGVTYSRSGYYAGLSAMHLTSPTVKLGDEDQIKLSTTYYFTAGGNIKTRNPLIWIEPSAMVKTDFVATKVNITGRGFYKYKGKLFCGGLSYSPGTSVTFLIGASIGKISLGYSYQMYTSGIGAANGSHDIVLNYSMDMNFYDKGKNKHKSIRIL